MNLCGTARADMTMLLRGCSPFEKNNAFNKSNIYEYRNKEDNNSQ